MEMRSIAGNTLRDVLNDANAQGIKKEDFINLMQSKDGLFILTYFAEED